jgi:hypothetical protein
MLKRIRRLVGCVWDSVLPIVPCTAIELIIVAVITLLLIGMLIPIVSMWLQI